MKKLLSLLLVEVICLAFVGCSGVENNNLGTQVNKNSSVVEPTTEEATTNEPTTVEPTTVYDISNEYEIILASGSDSDGNDYMMVGNETEDYEGVKVEVGVIKNDEWLIELTSDMPFLKENGEFLNGGGLSDAIGDILFVGNECFRYDCNIKNLTEVYYNVSTKEYYENKGKYDSILSWAECTFIGAKYNPYTVVENEEKILIPSSYYESETEYIVLDTKTMEAETHTVEAYLNNYTYVYPISEGMFATSRNDKVNFYNLDGSVAFDTSEYKSVNEEQRFIFEEGTCTFRIKNNNNTEYDITINNTGEVINSEEVG